jgi:hypothetical protein
MTAYPGQTLPRPNPTPAKPYPGQTQTTLVQLCTALWDSQSRAVVIQAGIKPGSIVKPPALRCRVLDHCATRESEKMHGKVLYQLITSYNIQEQLSQTVWLKHSSVFNHVSRYPQWFRALHLGDPVLEHTHQSITFRRSRTGTHMSEPSCKKSILKRLLYYHLHICKYILLLCNFLTFYYCVIFLHFVTV